MANPAKLTLLARTIYLLKPGDRFVYRRTSQMEVYLELSLSRGGTTVRHFRRRNGRGSIPVLFDTQTFEEATGRERPEWHGH